MKIRYLNTMKDLLAVHQFYAATSPTQRRAAAVIRWGLAGVFLLPAVGLAVLGAWVLAGVCVGGAVLYFLVFPLCLKWSRAEAVRTAHREGQNKGVLGPHELELAPPNLIERTSVNESSRWLGAIERIGTTPTHTFIFLTALSAHVIPRAAVTDGIMKPSCGR